MDDAGEKAWHRPMTQAWHRPTTPQTRRSATTQVETVGSRGRCWTLPAAVVSTQMPVVVRANHYCESCDDPVDMMH